MFEGFSEAEIKSVTNNVSTELFVQPNKRDIDLAKKAFAMNNRRILRVNRNKKVPAKDSRLSTPKEEEEYAEEQTETNCLETSENQYKEINITFAPCVLTSQSIITPSNNPEITAIKTANVELDDPGSNKVLNKFEETRKKLEAFNLERKEQLKQALSDRAKKTHEEVKQLNQIEEELKKLDSVLSNDVFILRNQIETASHDFMEAQKRFNKAEKEYVEAKMELFTKREKKDLLTSHLCSIIEQNELRKAEKLSDLLEKLEVLSKPLALEALQKTDVSDSVTEMNDKENS